MRVRKNRLRRVEAKVKLITLSPHDTYAIFPTSLTVVTILGEYGADKSKVKVVTHPIDIKEDISRQWRTVAKSSLKVPVLFTDSFKLIIDEKDVHLFKYDGTKTEILRNGKEIKVIYLLSAHHWTAHDCCIPILSTKVHV